MLEWIVLIFVIALSIVIVRIGVKFDVIEWRKMKHERMKESLQILCPHVEFGETDGKIWVTSHTGKPQGTQYYG